MTIQSVNGSAATVINGSGLNALCVSRQWREFFPGFTVADGNATNIYPYSTCGGVCCETNALVENCLIINNSAYYAGGLYFGTASNCVISGNVSIGSGGGAGKAH